ncbi:MAG: DUF166 domain-containing protein [Anaerolineales bacterium]|nr:DUF166 domain-containing protein [Anaerolineales bacterium]MDW8161749.1 DUF166 family protein [Anaerolineales bacterium]
MRLLVIYTGEYGQRHLKNLLARAPAHWEVNSWRAVSHFPPVIDDPEDFLPSEVPPSDLILSFAEVKGVAELLPDLARRSGAKAVLAPIDNEDWLPRGLARQLRNWLEDLGVACATPKPLCSLTERDYWISRRQRLPYRSPEIAEFARYFGRPSFTFTVDPQTRLVLAVAVNRDAVCGCAHFVAQGLVGVAVEEAQEKAGLLHHHYPCLASMGVDSDFSDTLMHVSGNILKDEVWDQVKPFCRIQYLIPGERSEN